MDQLSPPFIQKPGPWKGKLSQVELGTGKVAPVSATASIVSPLLVIAISSKSVRKRGKPPGSPGSSPALASGFLFLSLMSVIYDL